MNDLNGDLVCVPRYKREFFFTGLYSFRELLEKVRRNFPKPKSTKRNLAEIIFNRV